MNPPAHDDSKIRHILNQEIVSNAFLVAYDLGLFEYIGHAPKTSEQICDALNLPTRSVNALCLICCSLDLVDQQDTDLSLTSYAKTYLLQDSPYYFGPVLDLVIANHQLRTFDGVKLAITEGSAQNGIDDQDLFTLNDNDAQAGTIFTQAMHAKSIGPALSWLNHVDLSQYNTMLDIGAGAGTHSITACQKWSHLKSIVYDKPNIAQLSKQYLQQYNMVDRITVQVGDMWNDVFPAADVHFYSDIYHDWPIEKCQRLAEKSFTDLPAQGKIIVHEMLYDATQAVPLNVAGYNLNMLLWTQGQQFSDQSLMALLHNVGFINITKHRTFGDWGIVVGTKP